MNIDGCSRSYCSIFCYDYYGVLYEFGVLYFGFGVLALMGMC